MLLNMQKSTNDKKGKTSANIVSTLRDSDIRLKNDFSVLGVSALTQFDSLSAARVQMFNAHAKQCVPLLNPEYPYVFTGMENLVGKHNNAYKKVKNESKVFRKIKKYEDIVDNPSIHAVFIFDKVKKSFDVVIRKECENLTENFGYKYNNSSIDGFVDDDDIPAGTKLYKSSSYDKNDNYGYGTNALTMYTTSPETAEDACVVSESFARRCVSIETEEISIGMNDNDFLLNLYGTSCNYKPFPDIGESANGYLVATRRLFNDQILFDFKEESLNKIMDGDHIKYVSEMNQILDIDIFSNNEEIIDTPFNSQVNKYIKSQNRYYKEIKKTCEDIFNICKKKGYEYSRDVDYLYKRSLEMLDTSKKWKEGDSAFSNINIRFTVMKRSPLTIGSKITGRYGNKSVISDIWPDDKMPRTKDGRVVELLFSTTSVPNRITAFIIFELDINNINYKMMNYIKSLDTYKEKEQVLFDLIYMYNPDQYNQTRKFYDKFTLKEQKEFIDETINDRLYIQRIPMMEERPMFYKLNDIHKKYGDIVQADEVYINRWGREIKLVNDVWIGDMYIMKLKQTSKRGFSARSTGAINAKGIPCKDKMNKDHTETISRTPIRIGEFENANLRITVDSDELMLFNALYCSSVKGRRDIISAIFKDEDENGSILHNIDKSYNVRTAEIFDVLLKSLGVRVDFINKDSVIEPLDDTQISTFVDTESDEVNICTEYENYMYQQEKEIENDILSEKFVMTDNELEDAINENIHNNTHYVMGRFTA